MFEELLSFQTNLQPKEGRILIAEPHLQEEPFQRSVIFLCIHRENESMGYALNKPLQATLSDLFPHDVSSNFPLYVGGPVSTDTLHFLHNLPDLLGGEKIHEGIYWNGDLNALLRGINQKIITPQQCKIFLGYSGWGKGQLDEEIEKQSWLVAEPFEDLFLSTEDKSIWKDAILHLDKKFHAILNMPLSPDWN